MENESLILHIATDTPVRIVVLGRGRPYDVTGAYWLALPLVSDLDLVYPTTLVYVSEENPQTYNFIEAFPIITLNSSKLRLLVLNGDKWRIENISVGRPAVLNNTVTLPIVKPTTTSRLTNTTQPTTTTTESNIRGYYSYRNLRLIAGIAVFIVAVVIVLAYKKIRGKKT